MLDEANDFKRALNILEDIRSSCNKRHDFLFKQILYLHKRITIVSVVGALMGVGALLCIWGLWK